MDFIKDSIANFDFQLILRQKNFFERFAFLIWGTLIYSVSYTICYIPNNIVIGGTSGLAQIISNFTGIKLITLVAIISVIIQIICFILLGFKEGMNTLLGAILFPIFLQFSEIFLNYIDISNISLFLMVLLSAVIMGFGNGIILKSGFSGGGFQSLAQIIHKYFKISIGKASIIINGIIILAGAFIFSPSNMLYAIIGLVISSHITDKVLLGTSECKTFYIVTNKEKEVNEYITNNLGHSATIIDAKGGYTNDHKKVIMCAVPTRKYFIMKEVVKEIDKNSFFLATDTYEIKGGR